MADIVNEFLQAMQTIAQNEIKKQISDRIIQATVSSIVDEASAKYIIKYQNESFYAYYDNKKDKIPVGKNVAVQITDTNGELKGRKQILYIINEGNEKDYINVLDDENKYELKSPNLIGGDLNTEHGICSYEGTKSLTLYKKDEPSSILTITPGLFNKYLKKDYVIKVSAKFRTALNITQQNSGTYGLYITFKNTKNENADPRSLALLSNDMNGNPYLFTISSEQIKYFVFDNKDSEEWEITEIAFGCMNFPKDETKTEPDLFISNISLQMAQQLTDENLKGYYVKLTANNGIFFDAENQQLKITATVLNDGKICNNISNSSFTWWRKSSLFEDGWAQIFKEGNTALTGNTLTIKKEDVKTNKVDFQCRVNISNTIVKNEIALENENAKYILSFFVDGVEKSKKTELTEGTKIGKLECKVKSTEGEELEYHYKWGYVDINNRYTPLNDIAETQNFIENILAENLNKYRKYTCTVSVKDGADFVEVGSESFEVVYKDQIGTNYLLVIDNGQRVFRYDIRGNAPTASTKDNPLKIDALTFSFYNEDMEPFTAEQKGNLKITWKVPKNNTMLVHKGTPLNSDNDYYYYDSVTLDYGIEQKYDSFASNNTILLNVKYTNEQQKVISRDASAEFLFFKEGEDGFNGSNYTVKLKSRLFHSEEEDTPETVEREDYLPWLIKDNDGSHHAYIDVEVWDGADKVFDSLDASNGYSPSGGGNVRKITYEFSKNKDDVSMFNFDTDIINKITLNDNYKGITAASFFGKLHTDISYSNIIKVTVNYNGNIIYAYYPIVTLINFKYHYSYTLGSFALKYMYDDNFNMTNTEKIIKLNMTQNDKPVTEIEDLELQWAHLNHVGNDTDRGIIKKYQVGDKEKDRLTITMVPRYDCYCKNNLVMCTVKEYEQDKEPTFDPSGPIIVQPNYQMTTNYTKYHAVLLIPVYGYKNLFFNAGVNGWGGGEISIDESNDIILSPQIAAGEKNDDNTFSGIMIGTEKNESKLNSKATGLMGYYHGQRSIFLDADTGKAEFGIDEKSKIIIDPTNNTAEIRGGDYQEAKAGQPGSGMKIVLNDEPEIKFGNGCFSVNCEGALKSQSGTIGGWTISESKLTSDRAGMASYKEGENEYAFWAGNKNPSKAPFRVDFDGYVIANNIEYESCDPEDPSIFIKIRQGRIFSHDHINYKSSSKGFYLGTEGFSFGNGTEAEIFTVDPNGKVNIKDGYVGPQLVTTSALILREDGEGKANFSDIDKDGIIFNAKGIYAGPAKEGGNANAATVINTNGSLESVYGKFGTVHLNKDGFISNLKEEDESLKTIFTSSTIRNYKGNDSTKNVNWALNEDGTVQLPENIKIGDIELDKTVTSMPTFDNNAYRLYGVKDNSITEFEESFTLKEIQIPCIIIIENLS